MSKTTATKTRELKAAWRRGLTPPPLISVPDWQDEYRRIPKQEGGGKWRTSTVEAARGAQLAVTEPGVHIISAMTATQLLKTSLLLGVFGYFAHLDPCPMLLVQPKDEAAEAFSKERVTPMIKATKVLRERIGTRKSGRTAKRGGTKTRSSTETIGYKAFPGGFLAIVGAGSPTNLASRPIRVVLYDEIDKYEATREGDPITIGDERTARFGANYLSIRVCSPTVEGESRIEKSYAASDQRQASLCCPHCGHRQFLADFFKVVHWDKVLDEAGNVIGHAADLAHIVCEACGVAWSEGDRLRALDTIRWHQTRPFVCCGERHDPMSAYDQAWRSARADERDIDPVDQVWDWWFSKLWAVYRAKCRKCGSWAVPNKHAGFQLSKLFSPWRRDKPADIAERFLEAKGDEEKEQAWWNTQMGRTHRRRAGKEIKTETLLARREVYAAEVPDGVAVLTLSGDMQTGSETPRLEVEVVGWGRDEESWSIAHEVFEGDPNQPEFWARVDEYLRRRWLRADGRPFVVECACFDSGGHFTQQAYEFGPMGIIVIFINDLNASRGPFPAPFLCQRVAQR